MNAMTMSRTLPLAIVLFVHGVYCPGFYRPGIGIHRPEMPVNEENLQELPTSYPLYGCESHSSNLTLNGPSSKYEFECSEDTPSVCSLIERSLTSDTTTSYTFQRADIEFISMMEEEMNLMMKVLVPRIEGSVTCYVKGDTLAQQFYKLITRDRHSELVPIASANYVKNSDYIVLAEPAIIYLEREASNRKVVVKNEVGDTVLIFPKDAISGKMQHEDNPTRMNLDVKSRTRSRVTYEFGFSTPEQASYLIGFLD